MPRATKAVDAAKEAAKSASKQLAKQLGKKGAAKDKATSKVTGKAKAKSPAKSAPRTPAKSAVKSPVGSPVKAPVKAPGKPAAKAVREPAPQRKKAAASPRKVVPTPAAAAKAGPEPKGGKAPTDKFLLEQQVLLAEERATYEEQAASLKAQADQTAQEMEPGDIQFDDESGEGGTANIDRERDLALSAQARLAVDDIDHAMAKIANGTYGVCESCGQPIPRARLKALPQARLCVACKSGGLSRR